MPLSIGIDIGTSGCRALAIDAGGTIRAGASAHLPAPIKYGHHVEQLPELWWRALCHCLTDLGKKIDAQEVKSLAVDGTSGTLLLTEDDGEPLGPALMYNDARAHEQAKRITRMAPAETAAQGPSSALAKLLWFQDEGLQGVGLDQHASYAMHQADWLMGKLCGKMGHSDFNNALKMGFDAHAMCWPDWLNDLKVETRLLPEVHAPGTPMGTLLPELATAFGLPEEVHVCAGTTDSTASFLATGALETGDAVTALGSTLVLKVISNSPIYSPEHGVYSQPLPNLGSHDLDQRWLVGGASNSGGAVLRQHFTDERMRAMTARLNPEHPTGLDYYPLPGAGERFPVCDPRKQPKLTPRPGDDVQFFQAMLEGMSRIEEEGYKLLASLGAPYPVSVRTTGGGAQNTAWTHMREAALNVPVIPTDHQEAAYGCALLARSGKIAE
jgi:sugar (pentulose or hexulose) kinase